MDNRSLLRKKYLAKFISYSRSVRWGEISWDRDYENSFMGNIMVPLQSKEWACLLLLVIIIIYIMLWVYPWLESSSVKTRNFYIHISRHFILICSLYSFRAACVSSDRWAWVEVIKINLSLRTKVNNRLGLDMRAAQFSEQIRKNCASVEFSSKFQL